MSSQLFKAACVWLTCLCMSAGTLAQQEPESVVLGFRILEAPVGWGAAMADRIEAFIYPLQSGVFATVSDRQPVRLIAADDIERLNQEIQRLELLGMGRIIGSPHLMSRDSVTIRFEHWLDIPYFEATCHPATAVKYRDVSYNIVATPHVLSGARVVLSLQISESSNEPDDWGELFDVLGESIRDRPLQAVVLGRNGDTVMIGGIYRLTAKGLQRRLLYQWRRCMYEEHLIVEKTGALVKYLERYKREVLLFIKIRLLPQGWQSQTV